MGSIGQGSFFGLSECELSVCIKGIEERRRDEGSQDYYKIPVRVPRKMDSYGLKRTTDGQPSNRFLTKMEFRSTAVTVTRKQLFLLNFIIVKIPWCFPVNADLRYIKYI